MRGAMYRYGYLPDQVDNLTIAEIQDILQARIDGQKADFKDAASLAHTQALMIVNRLFPPADGTILELWDYYPELFAQDKALKEQTEQTDLWAKHRADMLAYSAQWERRKGDNIDS